MTTEAKADSPTVESLERDIASLKQEMMNVAKAGDFDTLRAKTQELSAKEKIVHDLLAARIQEERNKRNTGLVASLKSAFTKDLALVKEFGPVLRLSIDCSGEEPVWSAVLGSAVSRTVKSDAGSSAPRGKTNDRYGMSLDQVFRQYATPEEIASHDALPADKNSAKWNIKKAVLKRAEEAGLIKPIS